MFNNTKTQKCWKAWRYYFLPFEIWIGCFTDPETSLSRWVWCQSNYYLLCKKTETENNSTCYFFFQTLNSISAEKNSTIIFPLPIDFITHFLKGGSGNSSGSGSGGSPPISVKKEDWGPWYRIGAGFLNATFASKRESFFYKRFKNRKLSPLITKILSFILDLEFFITRAVTFWHNAKKKELVFFFRNSPFFGAASPPST